MLSKINPRMFSSEPIQRCSLASCKAACCLYGVWVDLLEIEKILKNADRIQVFLPEDRRDPELWFENGVESDEHLPSGKVRHTRVMADPHHYGGTSCIFLCSDYKCALQAASAAAGEHPWILKPFYCILHPLDLDDEGRITLDKTHLMLQEEASCLVPSSTPIPLAITFEPELRYLLGEEAYKVIFHHL
jgi:hypothetical protein